ncbi:hypothetical protein ABGB16_15820, partial [Micromonospora sp. B11E3]
MRVLEGFTGFKLSRAKLPLLWGDIGTAEVLEHRVRTVLGPLLEQTIRAVGEAGEGEVFDRFVAQTVPFVRKLAETADLLLAVIEAEKKFFLETEKGKRLAVAMFSFMQAEFAVAAAMWFWNPVGAAAHVAQTRSVIQAVLRSALVRSAASGTAMQMLFMPGSALLAEVSMMTDGLQSGVNWSAVGQQAAFAGAVAFLGTVAGPALGKVAGAVAGAVSKLGVSDATRILLTDLLTRPVLETGMEGLFGGLSGLMVGGYFAVSGADFVAGALSGAGGSAASGLGFVLSRAVMQPRVQVPRIDFTPDGRPVLPVGATPVGGDTSAGYQTGVDDPTAVGAGTQAAPPTPPPTLPPRPASNLPTPPPTPLSLELPTPNPDPSVPSWSVPSLSVPAAPAPQWVVAAGVPVVEQWYRFQQDLVDRYGGLLAGVARAGKSMAALAVPIERVFAGWVDARQGDPAVLAFLSAVGLPGTALTEGYLTGVRERAVARMAEALASAGEQIPAEVWSEQVVAALPAAFDLEALRAIAHLAAEHHIDRYLAAGLPTAAGTSWAVGTPTGAGVPAGAGAAVPSAAAIEAVKSAVRDRVDRSLDAILGTSAPVLPAVVAGPDAAQVSAVVNVVRQAVTDLPARFTAATIPGAPAPAANLATVDVQESGRAGAPTVPITPEQHTAAATRQAVEQFTDLAHQYGVKPARHGSFQRDWVNGYHQVLAQAAGSATPGTPGTPGTAGTPDAASARSTVPAGAASRADDTPIHHNTNTNTNANANANDSDSDSASGMSVSSDGVFSNLDTSDTISISDVSSPDESLGGVPGKHGLSDADSSRDEPVSGDPGRHGEPAVAATGQAVAATGQAVGMFESGQRVANWAAAEQVRAGSSGNLWWCVAATLDVFHTVYKRLGNRAVFDDRIIGPDGRLAPTMGWPQLMEILDTVPERVAHPDGVAGQDVLAALKAAPGSMVVVRAAPPNEPQHVFALHSQPQKSGPPRIQVRDPLLPDAADRPEPNDPIRDPWLRHLFASSTRVAAFDGNGRPATITDLLGQTTGHPQPTTTTDTDTSAFLLASTSPPRGPSHAMLTTSTDPADSSSGGLPSGQAGNGDPSGLASGDQEFQNVWDPDLDGMDLDTPKLDEWEPPQDTEQVQSPLSEMPGMGVAWVPLGVGDNATVAVPQQRDAGDHDLSHLDPKLLDPAFVEDLWMPYLDPDPDPDPDLDLGVGPGPGGVELSALPPGWGWTPPDGTEQVDSLYPPSGVPEVDVAWAPSVGGDNATAAVPQQWDAEDHDPSYLDPALLDPAFVEDLRMPDLGPDPDPDPGHLDRMGSTPTLDEGWEPGGDQVDSLYPLSGVSGVGVAWPSVVGDDVTAPDDRDTEDHGLSSVDPALLNPAFTQDLWMPDPAPAPDPDPDPDPDLDLDPDLVLDPDPDLVLDPDPDLVLDLEGVDGVGRPVLEFAVPADGYCVLSAFVVADPVLVRD